MATIDTQSVTVGAWTTGGGEYTPLINIYGVLVPGYGSISDGTCNFLSGAAYAALYWQDNGILFLQINSSAGTSADNSFSTINIGGTSFNESSATFTNNGTNVTWAWGAGTNPLGTSGTKSVVFDDGVTVDNNPENFIYIGSDKTPAVRSTNYYATFSTTVVGTTEPGTGFAIGTQVSNGTAISVSNGQYRIGTGAWTSTAGTVNQNQTVYFRGTSSSSFSTPITHSLTIGDTTRSFTTTTVAAVAPDTSVTVTTAFGNKQFGATATSATLNFGNATQGHTYRLRTYDGGANNGTSIGVTTANSSGNFAFTVPNTYLPAAQGDTKWFSLYAANPVDGTGSYVYVSGIVNDLWLTRRLATPTLVVSDDDAASATVGIILNVTNNSTATPTSLILRQYKNGVLQGSAITRTWTGNGNYAGNFTQPRNTGTDTYYYNVYLQEINQDFFPENNVTAYSNSTSQPSGLDYQAGYLLPDLGVVGTPTVNPISSVATSATVTVSGMARSTDEVAVRLVNGTSNLGSRSGNGNITWTGSLPTPGNTTNYELFTRRATSTGGDGTTWYDTNDQFSITRTAGETGAIAGGTTATEGDSGLPLTFTITNGTTGTYNWQITRNSGTVETGGEISSFTSGTFTGSSGSTTVTWYNNTIVETGFQGESFTVTLRTGGTVGSGTVLDTHNFTLYDNDAGITANNVIIEPSATQHTAVLVVSSGGGSISARIKDSGGTVQKTFTLIASGTDTEVISDVPSGTSETYSVEVYNGLAWIAGDTYTVTKRTYSVTAPTSIDEGSIGTFNVSTTNFGTGTLYWSVSPSGDFGVSSGPVSVSSNSGTFYISPSNDTTTEGAETATVSLRTGSTSGTVVATDTFTINDTSTGTAAPYGIQVFDSSGTLKVSYNSNITALAGAGSITVPGNSTTSLIPITNMVNTDQWYIVNQGSINIDFYGDYPAVLSVTKSTGGFTLTNTNSQTWTGEYWVFRVA